jgi:hypothetical protein
MTDNGRKRPSNEEMEALRRMAEELGAAPNGSDDYPDDDRVIIKLEAKKLNENLNAVEQALIDRGAPVYQRDRILVTIGTVKAISSDEKEITYQAIVPLTTASLPVIVARHCIFLKKDGRSKKWLPVLPPEYLMQEFLDCMSFKLGVLKGIVNHPIITASGEIVTAEGYDARTGIYFDPLGVEFPELPEITCENARDVATTALARIEKLFHTFAFVDEASRSVALSQLMTGVSRRSMKSAPVHVGDAAVRGSGKSKITRICSIVAIGRPAPALSQGHTAEEFEKRLAAMLLYGHPIIHIDNCSTIVEGDLLNSIATEETVALRILGLSRVVEITTGSLVCPNGNNITIKGDAIRRCVKYRLDPGVERPETLQFDYDPVADALANRAEIVVAILTILKARHVAKVAPPQVWQSFEDWSGTVRSALIWLGKADPCETVEELASDDPELAEMRAVYSQWWAHVGEWTKGVPIRMDPAHNSVLVTVAEVIKTATSKEVAEYEVVTDEKGFSIRTPKKNEAGEVIMKFVHPQFREALLAVAGNGAIVDPKKLGHWLKGRLDRIVRIEETRFTEDGKIREETWVLRIVRDKDLSRTGTARWRMIGKLEGFEDRETPF